MPTLILNISYMRTRYAVFPISFYPSCSWNHFRSRIRFVFRRLLKWSDSSSNHHLFIGSLPPGGGSSNLSSNPSNGANPPGSIDHHEGYKGVNYANGNQYSTMPIIKQGAKLDAGNIYQTTTLSTFGRGARGTTIRNH